MRPLNFADACQFPNIREIAERKYASNACNAASAAFTDNVLRCNGILFMPIYSWMVSDDWRFSSDKAALEITGAIEPDDVAGEAQKQTVYLRTIELFHAMRAAYTDAERSASYRRGADSLDAVLTTSSPLYHAAADSLLKSAVIQAWTSFEVLAEDLLTAAKDEYPHRFASIDFGNIGYRSRRRIRSAYKMAFSDDTTICGILDDEAVNALALLRNVLVHKSGIADQEFIEGVPTSRLLSPFSQLEKGQRVETNGIVVRSIVDSSIRCGYALIIAVNQWLI